MGRALDTSNLIMASLDGDEYGPEGLLTKPKSAFDLKESETDLNMIYNNVSLFRRIVNGG